jgi:predicted RNA-binding protein with PUA-like domain
MNYWLIKTDPDTWSWDDQVKAKKTGWDGVRNHQASGNMKKMAKGDLALFYHSQTDKAVVGIVEISKAYHPDPTDDTGQWGQVEVRAVKALKTPVTLAQIKADPKLKDIALVRQSRLSVMPIAPAAFEKICNMGAVV